MSPGEQGWAKCVRCGTWRRISETVEVSWVSLPGDQVAHGHQCCDDGVCSRMAGIGRGELDAKEIAP